MSVRITRTLIDDLDGSEAEATVAFSFMGTAYEVDLSTAHGAQMLDALQPYIDAGRRLNRKEAKATGVSRPSKYPSPSRVRRTGAIRAWARERGIEIAERGRIPAHIQEQYESEHTEAA